MFFMSWLSDSIVLVTRNESVKQYSHAKKNPMAKSHEVKVRKI